jgi:hypothetical protein
MSKIARPGAWGSLRCVVVGSWNWVANWGYLWGSKFRRLELTGAHKALEALGSTCNGSWAYRSHRDAAGFGEPSLQVVRVLGPDCQHRFQGAQFSGTATCSGQPSLQASGVLGPDCCMGFREHSTVVLLLAPGNQACCLLPSVTHGAVGAQGPAYLGVLVSLDFRVKLAGHVVGGSMNLWVPICAQEAELTT